ncbi:hypothetical protein PsunGV_gp025 [Pseudalatia unipuncta granulovirus]|uniref:Uncharacterized protein n=1 Tax=Pseudalatia unipuncta granulosis virus TaxID=36355 RepID=B6S6P4_GVPU|nr:hypothetical protein PsunGV_gp025 [Pseudalatia unipuncta granulovirus]ACH69375.1 unknown [Pseudalatia unipuncta granulovirus]
MTSLPINTTQIVASLPINTTQIEEEIDLDDYLPLNYEAATQQHSSVPDENLSLVPVVMETTEENTEELFKKHDLQQHNHEEAKPKKCVRFATDVDDDVQRKKIKMEKQEEETQEEPCAEEDDHEIFECNVSANSDNEDDEIRFEPQRNKSFTMEILVDHLLQTEQLLMENKLEDAKTKIEFLLNKCQNRTSVRKRVEVKRYKKNVQGYVHIFCAKRAIGFYSNSYEKPKSISQMVHFITIKCAVKSDKTDKMSSANIVRDLKKVASGYLYRVNDTPKKHMNVFKNKLDNCIKLMCRYVTENKLTVVFENSAWRSKLDEIPDVQSEVSD